MKITTSCLGKSKGGLRTKCVQKDPLQKQLNKHACRLDKERSCSENTTLSL